MEKMELLQKMIQEGLSAQFEVVTPDKARQYLGYNIHNRKLCTSAVKTYEKSMKNNEWKVNGDTICFAKDGSVTDGQQRLTAIAECGIAQICLVVRGLEKDSITTKDIGKGRTLADILTIDGVTNAGAVAAAVGSYMNLTNGKVGRFISKSRGVGVTDGLTKEEMRLFAIENIDVLNEVCTCAEKNYRYQKKFFAKSKLSAICYYLHVDKKFPLEYIDKFFYELYCGSDKKFLNQIRMRWVRSFENKNNEISVSIFFHELVKMFNAYFTGKYPKNVKWSEKRDGNKDFISYDEATYEP